MRTSADAVAEPKHAPCVVDVNHRERRVVLRVTGHEDAAHREAPHAWQDAGRRDPGLRRDQGDRGADRGVEPARQPAPEQNVEPARREALEFAFDEIVAELGHLRLATGKHAANHRAPNPRCMRQHRLRLDERGGTDHFGVVRGCPGKRLPAFERAVVRGDGRVRRDAENALAQLTLETVHDRDHRDQGGGAEGDPDHRREADERNEVVAPLRPRIAQADADFVGCEHGPDSGRGMCWHVSVCVGPRGEKIVPGRRPDRFNPAALPTPAPMARAAGSARVRGNEGVALG